MDFDAYDPGDFYDEMFVRAGQPRPETRLLVETLERLPAEELSQRQAAIQNMLMRLGATFNVYFEGQNTERILPFDIIPRIVGADEWNKLERGLKQRIHALNLFLQDAYGDRQIAKDGRIPAELILGSKGFLEPCIGLKPPQEVWCHVIGTDLVRDRDGHWYVLEDNLRCPSGVSYMLQNREAMKNTFPELFQAMNVRSIANYPGYLLETLLSLAPDYRQDPTVVVLTPGLYNSAYFEHSFLAQHMGVELVQGEDLVVVDGWVNMRTTQGLKPVDVIYRRIDDTFLDPQVFRADSLLGVPGLMEVYQAGRVAIANAPGTGVADDKAIYAYVPEMIRYYLAEDPILDNVPTYHCSDRQQRDRVLQELEHLVVKPTAESGGYGMLVGPHATPEERANFAQNIEAHPHRYIAQPTLSLSRVPTALSDGVAGCHVDLRPFILCGEDIRVVPGGLTRVALKRGSLVVNSSQGGGSKDTWVLSQ
ncbi:MAG: circularly permuted type 2 ATP-grasp protein [Cyanobacteria bacterium J06642_2]